MYRAVITSSSTNPPTTSIASQQFVSKRRLKIYYSLNHRNFTLESNVKIQTCTKNRNILVKDAADKIR